MRKNYLKHVFVFLAFIGSTSISNAQDSLFAETPKAAADWILANLNPTQCGGRLIDRAMLATPPTQEQLEGNYSQIHDFESWVGIWADAESAKSNSDVPGVVQQFMTDLGSFVSTENFVTDNQVMPFGLVLQHVNHIKDETVPNIQNNQVIPPANEEDLYEQLVLKSATVLELYGNEEYTTGVIKYDPKFISVSSDVSNLLIKIDVGNGFENFGPNNPEITYSRVGTMKQATARVSYTIGTTQYNDDIHFYLTKDGAQATVKFNPFSYKSTFYSSVPGISYRYGVILGCGNTSIRRPVIFVPPYRPNVQPVTLNGYYKQYNVKAMFHYLYQKGYDVIILKDNVGNESIQSGGRALLDFINKINVDKKNSYPNEDWENVVLGFSMGGQVTRYALMKGEQDHMNRDGAHPHTKLYVPFDSPHHGANIPIGCQTVIYEMARTLNPFALIHAVFLNDDASRDMGLHAVYNSSIVSTGPNAYRITPSPAPDYTGLQNDYQNNLLHAYSNLSDERRAYPTFSRNVAVSMGAYSNNYTMDPGHGLNPGHLLFSQNVFIPIPFAARIFRRKLYAAKYSSSANCFDRFDLRMFFIIPVIFDRDYRTYYAKEWDNAQGGHKNVFYDGAVIGATSIMRSSAFFFGTKHYNNKINFMPLVSSLGIKKTLWPNNSLYYNPQTENLFKQSPSSTSNYFGYPNVGHPSNHFSITPFEAVYADKDIYEHIKYSELDGIANTSNRLVELRDFLLNEIESDVVQLQNKVIGENNVISDPSHVYKAWYKAKERIEFGENVTYKTDPGEYVIKDDGEVKAYAQKSVVLTSGFVAENGSDFHAYIDTKGFCSENGKYDGGQPNISQMEEDVELSENVSQLLDQDKESLLKVYPNPSTGEVTVVTTGMDHGYLRIVNALGKMIYYEEFYKRDEIKIDLTGYGKGLFIANIYNDKESKTARIIIK